MNLNELTTSDLAALRGRVATKSAAASAFLRYTSGIGVQLFVGLFVAVALPALLYQSLIDVLGPMVNVEASLIGMGWAMALGYFFVRKLSEYPGVRASSFILPIFVGSYGFTMLIFFMMRIDYSRFLVLTSFVLTVAFFYVIFLAARRWGRPNLSIVPGVETEALQHLGLVNCSTLSSANADPGDATPVVVDLRQQLDRVWEDFVTDCALSGRPIYDSRQLLESLTGRVVVERLSETRLGSLLPDVVYAGVKGVLDRILALAVLVFTAPFLLLIGAAIRIESKGPALFRQERIGQGGKRFTVYKFRSMRLVDEAEEIGALMTQERDARITAMGKILRRTRIDELPQILNILRGQMSWIGPRPEAVPLSQWYSEQIPFYRYRHTVRPGLTGWAQVNQGHVTTLEEAAVKLQYDFFYIKHFSLWLDLLVLCKTVKVVVNGHGAK